MIELTTRSRNTLWAKIFVEDGERAVCVILYRDGIPISADRFDQGTAIEAVTELRCWISSRRLSAQSHKMLICEFRDEFQRLQRFRRLGYDPSYDFLGRPEERRLPEIPEFATH